MDPVTDERAVIRRCLREYVDVRYINGDIHNLLHVEIIDGKIWIQRDGTEEGIACALVEAGIPKTRIVLGFWDPEARKLGEFAAA